MSHTLEDRGEGPWADAAALHDGTDYAGLAKLWSRPRRSRQPGGTLREPPWRLAAI